MNCTNNINRRSKVMKTEKVAVVVGRFQVPTLHKGHLYLFDRAMEWADRIVVVLGVFAGMPDEKNPLPFQSRKEMVLQELAKYNPTVLPIHDVGNAALWSANLDALIDEHCQGTSVRLVGSRDSFIGEYTGKYEVWDIDPEGQYSGTNMRNNVQESYGNSAEFRAGMIYAVMNRQPVSYQTVDMLPTFVSGGVKYALLARKKRDGEKMRFFGGFVDVSDKSLEQAALRELAEEAPGIQPLSVPKYKGSMRVDDWRYNRSPDGILTALFEVSIVSGLDIKPGDDVDEVLVVPLQDLLQNPAMLISGHKELAENLLCNRAERR